MLKNQTENTQQQQQEIEDDAIKEEVEPVHHHADRGGHATYILFCLI